MLTFLMLEGVAEDYFLGNSQALEPCFDYRKRSLGEERWLTQLIIDRKHALGGIGISRRSICETVALAIAMSFLAHRRRWFIGCLANEVSGMSDPESWIHYPLPSAFRLAKYTFGTPSFPFLLTRFNLLRQTQYFWTNLTLWMSSFGLIWISLVFVASYDDLSSALLQPVFFLLNPLQRIVTQIYTVATIRYRTWGTRNVPSASKLLVKSSTKNDGACEALDSAFRCCFSSHIDARLLMAPHSELCFRGFEGFGHRFPSR